MFPPPPRLLMNFFVFKGMMLKFFFEELMCIRWSDRPPILTACTFGQKYKRLKKKLLKNNTCVYPLWIFFVLAEIGRKKFWSFFTTLFVIIIKKILKRSWSTSKFLIFCQKLWNFGQNWLFLGNNYVLHTWTFFVMAEFGWKNFWRIF